MPDEPRFAVAKACVGFAQTRAAARESTLTSVPVSTSPASTRFEDVYSWRARRLSIVGARFAGDVAARCCFDFTAADCGGRRRHRAGRVKQSCPRLCASSVPAPSTMLAFTPSTLRRCHVTRAEHLDRRLERYGLAKAHVHAGRDAAMSGKTGGVRHRFVEQRHHDAAVRDAAPALILRRERNARAHAVARRRCGRSADACRSVVGPHAKQLPSSKGTSLIVRRSGGRRDKPGARPRASSSAPRRSDIRSAPTRTLRASES